VHRGLDA